MNESKLKFNELSKTSELLNFSALLKELGKWTSGLALLMIGTLYTSYYLGASKEIVFASPMIAAFIVTIVAIYTRPKSIIFYIPLIAMISSCTHVIIVAFDAKFSTSISHGVFALGDSLFNDISRFVVLFIAFLIAMFASSTVVVKYNLEESNSFWIRNAFFIFIFLPFIGPTLYSIVANSLLENFSDTSYLYKYTILITVFFAVTLPSIIALFLSKKTRGFRTYIIHTLRD